MQIKFEDIRKGDRIEVTYKFEDHERAWRGVVHHPILEGWRTESGVTLVWKNEPDATITLLERPTPVEPRGLGAVVRASVKYGNEGGLWVRYRSRYANAPWVQANHSNFAARQFWANFDPATIEVLHEGFDE